MNVNTVNVSIKVYQLLMLYIFYLQNNREVRAGEITHRDASQVKGASMKFSKDGVSTTRSAISEQKKSQFSTPKGSINQESSRMAKNSGLTISTKGICTASSSSVTSSQVKLTERFYTPLFLLIHDEDLIQFYNYVLKKVNYFFCLKIPISLFKITDLNKISEMYVIF